MHHHVPAVKMTLMFQVTDTQQALGEADLSRLKASVSAFFSKQQGPPSDRSSTTPLVEESAASSTTTASAAAPVSKAAEKAIAPTKKGKGGSDPAVSVLSIVAGQQQELTRWSNMLQTDNGIILQDAKCAEWLAGLLKAHSTS